MSEEIKAGDIVTLKSDGPDMTVEWVNKDGYANCRWFPSMTEPPQMLNVKTVALVKRR